MKIAKSGGADSLKRKLKLYRVPLKSGGAAVQ